MASTPARVYLDEDVSVVIATILQARGFEALTARDTGLLGRADSEQLEFGAEAGRVLLTHNRVDFDRLHRGWIEGGRQHWGIIVARRRSPSDLALRVARLLARLTADELKNQILYV